MKIILLKKILRIGLRNKASKTVNDQLKTLHQLGHSRHRSVNNFMVNIMAAVVAYCLNPIELKEILELSPIVYKKQLLEVVLPNWKAKDDGCHTINAEDNFVVLDAIRLSPKS